MYISIDTQNGFCEGGNLAVEGGKKSGDKQAQHLEENKDKYAIVVATADWHPSSHCSFKENGGIWPPHCKQFSADAAIYQPLLDVLETCPHFEVLTKGCDEDGTAGSPSESRGWWKPADGSFILSLLSRRSERRKAE